MAKTNRYPKARPRATEYEELRKLYSGKDTNPGFALIGSLFLADVATVVQ